jgi:cobalamin biosynthesis protein CobW
MRTGRIPATVITGFLGAGKTTLLRHVLAHAGGRRIAVIVNEFGSIGIDGATLRSCGLPDCQDEDIVELANGCLCCTVADDFIPTMERLLDRADPPEHIVIETSGLALPKPLLKAFNWPALRARVTVDGVIAVIDGRAVADGRFADDPEAVARQRAADPSLDHDNPLAEVFEDQVNAADLLVINKADLLDEQALAQLRASLESANPRAAVLTAKEGAVPPAILLGLGAAAEADLAARPSHHDAEDGAHEHDDFESFVVSIGEIDAPETLVQRMQLAATAHDILRMKGFVAVRDRRLRLEVQAVGRRVRHQFVTQSVATGLVVIGTRGMDQAAIAASLVGFAT